MKKRNFKKTSILGILFFLPVLFLLFLYPSKNYSTYLDIVNENVVELSNFQTENKESITLENNITVLGFLGENPENEAISVLNLKELVYDKFKGFKRFQVLIIVSEGTQEQVKLLKKELYQYDELKYWHFVFGNSESIKNIYNSLKSKGDLKADLSTEKVFIIDEDMNQRGRLDDREPYEVEKNKPVKELYSYNCIEVSEIKNKMGDDMRILFTEYRQKRKGNFDSSSRRAEDIKTQDETSK